MMGRHGPAPEPTALKLVHGNPGKRPLNKAEPRPARRRPRRPDWLEGEAQAAWDELIPMLDAMGVLTEVDGRAVSRYCKLWARWVKLTAMIDKAGEVYPMRDKDGNVTSFRTFPQVKIIESLSCELRMLEREFGLTASARSNLTVGAPEAEKSPLEELIERGRASRTNPTAG